MFKNEFQGFENSYVIIGGTATSIVLDSFKFDGRATKDYDLVITEEGRNQKFYEKMIKFLKEGGYIPEALGEKGKLYRFTTNNKDYPKILELFSIQPLKQLEKIGRTAPLQFVEGMSLSALLLDKEYYDLLIKERQINNGYSILSNKGLIIFKAKAWLDLLLRKKEGQKVDSKNIKKHLNDIARLTGTLSRDDKVSISDGIYNDMQLFLKQLKENMELIPKNDAIVLTPEEIIEILTDLFKR
ncbi:MAG: hypothetical protein LBV67_09225 [Streptococcaceae bacterium]|nr:hypothetical protein [Streptococcaceae bacterium]